MYEAILTVKSDCYEPEALARYVDAQLDDLRKNVGIKEISCQPVLPITPEDAVLDELRAVWGIIAYMVLRLSDLYEDNPWLNDKVNLESITPMSLDEWAVAITARMEELRAGT